MPIQGSDTQMYILYGLIITVLMHLYFPHGISVHVGGDAIHVNVKRCLHM